MADLYDQVQKLERRVKELETSQGNTERVTGNKFIQSLKNRLNALFGDGTSDVTTGNIDRTISIPQGGGSAEVLDYPDGFLRIEEEGVIYNVPFYNNI